MRVYSDGIGITYLGFTLSFRLKNISTNMRSLFNLIKMIPGVLLFYQTADAKDEKAISSFPFFNSADYTNFLLTFKLYGQDEEDCHYDARSSLSAHWQQLQHVLSEGQCGAANSSFLPSDCSILWETTFEGLHYPTIQLSQCNELISAQSIQANGYSEPIPTPFSQCIFNMTAQIMQNSTLISQLQHCRKINKQNGLDLLFMAMFLPPIYFLCHRRGLGTDTTPEIRSIVDELFSGECVRLFRWLFLILFKLKPNETLFPTHDINNKMDKMDGAIVSYFFMLILFTTGLYPMFSTGIIKGILDQIPANPNPDIQESLGKIKNWQLRDLSYNRMASISYVLLLFLKITVDLSLVEKNIYLYAAIIINSMLAHELINFCRTWSLKPQLVNLIRLFNQEEQEGIELLPMQIEQADPEQGELTDDENSEPGDVSSSEDDSLSPQEEQERIELLLPMQMEQGELTGDENSEPGDVSSSEDGSLSPQDSSDSDERSYSRLVRKTPSPSASFDNSYNFSQSLFPEDKSKQEENSDDPLHTETIKLLG